MEPNIELLGTKIDPDKLILSKARSFLQAVSFSAFCHIINVQKVENGKEIIIFETEVEIPQHPKFDIRKNETVAVVFDPVDFDVPKVFMLREDFPLLSHQLMEPQEKPRSLCLYNIPYQEIKIFWTGFIFLERIREWLKLSSIGQLHQNDQPLEPLMTGDDGTLLLATPINENGEVYLYAISEDHQGKIFLFASNQSLNIPAIGFPARFEYFRGDSHVHGTIRRTPENLADLNEMLRPAGINLTDELVNKLKKYKSDNEVLDKRLLICIELPIVRIEGDKDFSVDAFAFITTMTLQEIGKIMNLWDDMNTPYNAIILFEAINKEAMKEVKLGILKPILPFTRELAQHINGVHIRRPEPNIVAVGCGALGSQIIINLVRAGIGQWTIVDADNLFPHNLGRNALMGYDVLRLKAEQLALQANSILPGIAKAIVSDVIKDKQNKEFSDSLKSTELILDMSASTAAVRALTEYPERKRICSFFTNPQGNDVVAIAEDKALTHSSLVLEIQYLRFIWKTPELHDHFRRDEKIRYSTGCRDMSFILPQDSVAHAAAIASKVTKILLDDPKPYISIWRTDSATFETKRYDAPISKPFQQYLVDWMVITDEFVLSRIFASRKRKLPNETGGILLGHYDMQRKIIYVADIIESPEDSVEYPTAYIRGIKNIGKEIAKIREITAGGLQYIGEWHTHPDGFSCQMSSDDAILFNWLHGNMCQEGYPAIMLIAGELEDHALYLADETC